MNDQTTQMVLLTTCLTVLLVMSMSTRRMMRQRLYDDHPGEYAVRLAAHFVVLISCTIMVLVSLFR